jgi:pimeloyl-ACP methyl ester carboxylesterase
METVDLVYDRAGEGGYPLLLVHGWPETRRIWGRNVAPLAERGFDVIAPDLRGFGDSPLAPDGFYDLAAHANDIAALLGRLGVERCSAVGGDLGGGVVIDLALRFEGLVERQVIFNSILPALPDMPQELPAQTRQAADYFVRQGRDADALAAELDTPDKRRRYIAQFYGPRFWASPGSFRREDVDVMTEPFADADRLRAGFGNYESALGSRPVSDTPRWFEPSPVETLILYGPDDHVIWPDFPERAKLVFPNRVGPFVVTGAGHFLQWEQADVLNGAVHSFLRDLLV